MNARKIKSNGRVTTASLEEPFWQELKRLADEADMNVGDYAFTVLQTRRRDGNVSRCLRLHVLQTLNDEISHLQSKLARLQQAATAPAE